MTIQTIFYLSDFKEKQFFKFWKEEFKKAEKMDAQELKKWAETMGEYMDDFAPSAYYIREEIEHLFNNILSA